MKKNYQFLGIVTFILFSFQSFSQTWSSSSGTLSVNPITTKVGIGTLIPSNQLHVVSEAYENTRLERLNSSFGPALSLCPQNLPNLNSSLGSIQFGGYLSDSYFVGAGIGAYADNMWSSTKKNTRLEFSTSNNNVLALRMTLKSDGKLVIGSSTLNTPAGYRLFVEEGILTEKVKVAVKNSTDWADFVFASDYNLKSLHEVEAFIIQNNHLPDVPSASAMVENGLDVAKTDALLLQKIEELTLYIIELQKQVDILKKQ